MSVRYVRKENASDLYLRKCHRLCHVYHFFYTSGVSPLHFNMPIHFIHKQSRHSMINCAYHLIADLLIPTQLFSANNLRIRVKWNHLMHMRYLRKMFALRRTSHFIQDDWFNLISCLLHSNKKMFRDDSDWHVLDRQFFCSIFPKALEWA